MFARKRRRWIFAALIVLALSAFLAWRSLRPMSIFVVSEAFARPIDTLAYEPEAQALSAARCGACHPEEHREWATSMHSRAWSDPYFRIDWAFDDHQVICKNCHIPLDRQQEERVLGFRDAEMLDPVLVRNSAFDRELQDEGVTCAGCHFREGRILGRTGSAAAPHPVQKIPEPNEMCLRCHVVQGERWDTFYRLPPCGTTAEIAAPRDSSWKGSGEYLVTDASALGCVECHMPAVQRQRGGATSSGRRHIWRGGHDPDMVRTALGAALTAGVAADGMRIAHLELANTGTAHSFPTGTPDRHLTVRLRALDGDGRVLQETNETLERLIMWRPFIVDLRDTRLVRGAPRRYELRLPAGARSVEAQVRYHLLAESRRERIGYQPAEPISYPVFEQRIPLH